MSTTGEKSVSTVGGTWRDRTRAQLLVAGAGLLVLTGCGPSPEKPDEGELTAVVVSRNDHPILFGGGTVDSWSRAVVLTRDELLAAYDDRWPGRDEPADHDFAYLVVEVAIADIPAEAVTDVAEGRFRLPWSGAGRYVCLGNEHEGAVSTAGCVLVDVEAPAAITIESSIGGLGLRG